jgi:hypothetical protein
MSSRSAGTRLPLLLALTLVSSLLVASAAGATSTGSQELWKSDFGGGTTAAFRSIGDGLPSTVWNGRHNVSFGTHDGRAAMGAFLPKDQQDGFKLNARFSELGFQPQKALRLDYDVFVPNAETLALDLKLPGFGSAPADKNLWYVSTGGIKHADSASIRIHTRAAGAWSIPHPYIEAYVYADSGGGQVRKDWGLYWRFSESMNGTGSRKGDEFTIPVGRWFTISVEAEMNSPGKADGKLRMWLDGKQGIDITDMVYVTAPPYEWTQTVFGTFYNSGSHAATTMRFANMRMGTLGSLTAPATAPTITAPQIDVSASGSTATGSYTIHTDRSVAFQRVVLAVRDASGQMYDFAGFNDVTIDGARSFSGSRTGLPDGTYTARVAYQLDGTWRQIGDTRTFVVASGPTATAATPVTGDFNGDGREQLGWFHDGSWYLPIGTGQTTTVVRFGEAGDQPVTGDWNGNGRDGIGVVRGNAWQLRQTPTSGPSELAFTYGRARDVPVVGDWNNDGRDGIGVYRDGRWLLRQTASSGKEQLAASFGSKGDVPRAGRWTAGKADGLGLVRGDTWLIRLTPTGGSAQHTYRFGLSTDRPVVGDWNANGQQTSGMVRDDRWLVSNQLPAGSVDATIRYAPTSVSPS